MTESAGDRLQVTRDDDDDKLSDASWCMVGGSDQDDDLFTDRVATDQENVPQEETSASPPGASDNGKAVPVQIGEEINDWTIIDGPLEYDPPEYLATSVQSGAESDVTSSKELPPPQAAPQKMFVTVTVATAVSATPPAAGTPTPSSNTPVLNTVNVTPADSQWKSVPPPRAQPMDSPPPPAPPAKMTNPPVTHPVTSPTTSSPPSNSNLPPGISVSACAKCNTVLASLQYRSSTNYRGFRGGASLFSKYCNVRKGKTETRTFSSGVYTISGVSCVQCGEYVGWIYEDCEAQQNKFKIGMLCLEDSTTTVVPNVAADHDVGKQSMAGLTNGLAAIEVGSGQPGRSHDRSGANLQPLPIRPLNMERTA